MESFAVLLEPYKDLISSSAAIVTYLHQLSGLAICNDIRKQKSTVGFSILPFLAGTVISVLVLRFGAILNDTTTVHVNLIGTALNLSYVCYYFWYTNNIKDKTLAWAQIGYASAFVAAVFAYTYVENQKDLPFRYGLILTAVLFYFVGSPMLHLGEIIRNKSTAGMPFPIILSGTLISFLWFLYGVVTREYFVIFQNAVIFLMSAVQLSLFAVYGFPKPTHKSKKSGSPANINNNDKKKN
ncbi:sugar transporter SWEET1-like [Contarinia nasturtii]|uniref:sugar transporter SWEET1-like n=1 Tax=Contarinia nasturtii TaxID=265458 RepID=UPI0012D3A89D|nr:sugar transporter SWEET1-like [Contarinia nasturtii]XP_031632134.1 sugar transporter SWEET1-like [Contarinia nasturtii]XP_031632136.1 sugar transporter SWEET1-like [Contarinia nasturtii]XP_031632137.1 sugar transporter SWEET1-like [Contarinia nasturtii]XP_031632138.1 sugar transporter SWEET1-like [Contarinia nasturtii]XP_031632139.1 sugar transporter SWEET1-like [Contarinia nasturtii]